MAIKKVRIVSDGTTLGTRITDDETGELLPVVGFKIMGSVGQDLLRIELVLFKPELDISAEAEIV